MSMPIDYNGFKVVITVNKAPEDAQRRWRGRFGFWKNDDSTFSSPSVSSPFTGTISRLEENPRDARSKALRIAKSIIDAELARHDGRVTYSQDVLARH